MPSIKKTYTLAEAVEYLKRETDTPDLSVDDIVVLAAEGRLSVCFPYRGKLGLFKDPSESSEHPLAALNESIWGKAQSTNYFHGVLRSISRPTPNTEVADLQGNLRKTHTLLPVRVVPVTVFSSDPPVEIGTPARHNWRRVHDTEGPFACTPKTSLVPEAEWLVYAEDLHRLAARPASTVTTKPGTHTSATGLKASSTRRVVSTKSRRDTLTPIIELAQSKCANPEDVSAVWATLSVMAEQKVPPLFGATDDGIQWLKNGETAIFSRRALAERIRRTQAR